MFKKKSKVKQVENVERPAKIPAPYDDGMGNLRPLRDFVHGDELVDQLEKNRQKRREWALKYLGDPADEKNWWED